MNSWLALYAISVTLPLTSRGARLVTSFTLYDVSNKRSPLRGAFKLLKRNLLALLSLIIVLWNKRIFCSAHVRKQSRGHVRWTDSLSYKGKGGRNSFPFFRPYILLLPQEVGILYIERLLQFYSDCFETLQVFRSWAEDVHVVWT